MEQVFWDTAAQLSSFPRLDALLRTLQSLGQIYTPQKMGYIFKLATATLQYSSLPRLSYMLFLPWRRAVYIFDRYGVINNGFLCCFRGLAFFQLQLFPFVFAVVVFRCSGGGDAAWIHHADVGRHVDAAATAVRRRHQYPLYTRRLLFAFFARVSFSFLSLLLGS